MKFYLPLNSHGKFFCKTVDAYGNIDLLSLTKVSCDKSYDIYTVSLKSNFNAAPGIVNLSILILDGDRIINSPSVNLTLKYDNYNAVNKLILMQELSDDIAKKYEQIVKLTEMNIKLYSDIKEASGK